MNPKDVLIFRDDEQRKKKRGLIVKIENLRVKQVGNSKLKKMTSEDVENCPAIIEKLNQNLATYNETKITNIKNLMNHCRNLIINRIGGDHISVKLIDPANYLSIGVVDDFYMENNNTKKIYTRDGLMSAMKNKSFRFPTQCECPAFNKLIN